MSEIDNMFVHLTNVAIQKHGVHLSILHYHDNTLYDCRMSIIVVTVESGQLLTFVSTLRGPGARKYGHIYLTFLLIICYRQLINCLMTFIG